MVYCREHKKYVTGRNGREYHIQKFNCDFIRDYKPNREQLPKYNERKKGNDNADHKTPYLYKRERRKRSIYRTNKKKGKR